MEAVDKQFGDRWEQEKQISQQLRKDLEAKVGIRNTAVCLLIAFPVLDVAMAARCHVAIPTLESCGTIMNTPTFGCRCQHQESAMQRQTRMLQKLQATLQTKDKVSAGLMKQTVEWKGIIRKLDNALIKAKKDVEHAKVAQLDAETKLEQYRNTYRPQAAAYLHSQYLLSNKVQSLQYLASRTLLVLMIWTADQSRVALASPYQRIRISILIAICSASNDEFCTSGSLL